MSGNGSTAAHCAALAGNCEVLLAILDAGVTVDVADSNLITPLMCATRNCHLECLLLLIQRGADVRRQSVDGRTAAHYTAERGNVEMLRVLIASGADLLSVAWGLSVVDSACVASRTDAASLALACGCRFALTLREMESHFFFCGCFNRVVCGLSSVDYTL